MNNFEFKGKIIINCILNVITGIHIGGATEGFEIGGEDIVIKDPLTGFPFIPGSSIKGKMRSLFEWFNDNSYSIKKQIQEQKQKEFNKIFEELTKKGVPIEEAKKKAGEDVESKTYPIGPCDCGECDACIIFGVSADKTKGKGPTRLTVRDSMPTDDTKKKWEFELGEDIYTEIKWENTINRITSEAMPRQFERVPAGSKFYVEMVYDIYELLDFLRFEKVLQSIKLLEDSYLGGSGTRGYGKIKFEKISVSWLSKNYYTSTESKIILIGEEGEIKEVWSKLIINKVFEKLIEDAKKSIPETAEKEEKSINS